MKHILMPVDFSTNSHSAVLFAAQLAEKMGATLHLLHVLELGHEKLYQPFSLHEKYNDLVLCERKEQLQKLTNTLKQDNQSLQLQAELLSGPTVKTILDFANDKMMDWIIIGNTGAGKMTRVMFGSIAEKIINNGVFPVISLPAKAAVQVPDTIVFATSHFEKDKKVLAPLVELARLFQSAIHVIFFCDATSENLSYNIDQALRLDMYAGYLKTTYPDIRFKALTIEGRTLADAIEDYEVNNGADMLAVVPYAKDFFERIKSTTDKMAFQSSVPVLILPCNGRAVNSEPTANEKPATSQ